MKANRYITVLAAMLLAVSCSLKEDTTALSTPDNYFRKISECQSVINSCYIPLKTIYNRDMMIAVECVSDILTIPTNGILDARLDISPSSPRFGATMWTQCYLGVQRCNFAVYGIEKARRNKVLDDGQYADFLCEAKTLRAIYYWNLTSFFGDVPFYFDYVENNEVEDRIAVLPRMDAVASRDSIVADLMPVAALASGTRTSDNVGARVGAACAWMISAKLAMWNRKWDVALEALRHIEEIYGDLADYDYAFNASFRNKNTPESILEIQHTYVEGGLAYTGMVAAIATPPLTKLDDGTVLYGGVEIPELGTQATTWLAMRPTYYFSGGLQSRLSKDIRKDCNLAWEYNGQEFDNVASKPYVGPKFWCPGMMTYQDSNNYKVFRYADALLMMAECLCENGELTESVRYLNIVKARAGLKDYEFRSESRLRQEIRDERGRELFGEFQRKYDLVRWGIWYESTLSNNDYKELLANIKPCHRYYPIPDVEVVYSKYHLDNKEYEKYGL